MTLNQERKLWQLVGFAVLFVGVAIMIAAVAMLLNFDDPLDKSPSRIQAIGAAVALSGVCALVLARILRLLGGSETQPSLLWSVVSYGSLVVGAIGGFVEAIIWKNAVSAGAQDGGLTSWQKSGVLGFGFLLMAGVIALIGDRTARQFIASKSLRSRGTSTGS
jgi:hypothetical protein